MTSSQKRDSISILENPMSFDDPNFLKAFFEIHSGLPREGPGSKEATHRAAGMLTKLPAKPTILDIGCGPGQQTMDLAEFFPSAKITAVDLHEPFVAECRRRAETNGYRDRIHCETGDMNALPYQPGGFDILWSEGAAYSMGVANALKKWKPLLKSGGYLAFTEVTWTSIQQPEEIRDFWNAEYPDIKGVEANLEQIANAGYEIVGHFLLPSGAWWDDYYRHIEAKIPLLKEKYKDNKVALSAIKVHEDEITMFRDHGSHYTYTFFVALKP